MKKLTNAIQKWLDADGGWKRGDARLYSKREWSERGETVGKGSELTLVVDGSPLYGALNYGEPSWTLQTELDALASAHDCYAEMGYAWSVHFYKK